jgi:hypothetical protein
MIFVSYARRDADAVATLESHLSRWRLETFADRTIIGGQDWWDVILEHIRMANVFVFVASEASVMSMWCRSELSYAEALHRPIVPVVIDDVDLRLAPEPIRRRAPVDMRDSDQHRVIDFIKAITDAPPSPPLPKPLPPAPVDPTAVLSPLREKVQSLTLDYRQQEHLLHDLSDHLDNIDLEGLVLAMLRDLRGRRDITESAARAIDDLVRRCTRHAELFPAESLRALLTHVDMGQCTPITGFGLTDSLVGSRRELARHWSESYGYPMGPAEDDLPRVAQFISVMMNPVALRQGLADHLRRQLASRLDVSMVGAGGDRSLSSLLSMAWRRRLGEVDPEPHMVLASLPCPVYINAHPASLLIEALQESGRAPAVDYCRWRGDVNWPPSPFADGGDFVPTVDRPLVFQVFGSLDLPGSVVLTRDDYLDFLGAVTANKSLVPTVVRRVLADSALFLLGFDLEDLDISVLLHTLINQEGARRLRGYTHVAAQFDLKVSVISPERARQYLERYFTHRDPPIDIIWATVDQLTTELAMLRQPVG